MAHLALLRHPGGQMVWIRCALVVLQVARDTGRRGQIEIPTRVALITLQLCVSTSERKAHCVVIEIRWLPSRGRVTFLASLWNSEGDVVRIVRLLEIGQVATHARRRRALVLAANVTCRAVEGGVHPGESEPGDFQMIELRAEPTVDGVALLALDRKGRGHMIGLGSLLIGALVAGVALDGESLELPDRLALMAIRAVKPGMSSHQGETVIVLPHPLQNDIPAFDRMALCAISSHLAAMNVGVAIGAVRPGVREHRLSMTLRTRHSLVQATQRVFGLVVIEFRDCANRLPPRGRMAVLARDI